jgi:hypothetical protein
MNLKAMFPYCEYTHSFTFGYLYPIPYDYFGGFVQCQNITFLEMFIFMPVSSNVLVKSYTKRSIVNSIQGSWVTNPNCEVGW